MYNNITLILKILPKKNVVQIVWYTFIRLDHINAFIFAVI